MSESESIRETVNNILSRLNALEEKHSMSTAEFMSAFGRGELRETEEFLGWHTVAEGWNTIAHKVAVYPLLQKSIEKLKLLAREQRDIGVENLRECFEALRQAKEETE